MRQLAIVSILNATLHDPAHDVKFSWALLAVIIGLITPLSAIRGITNSITNGITNGITNEAQILVTWHVLSCGHPAQLPLIYALRGPLM